MPPRELEEAHRWAQLAVRVWVPVLSTSTKYEHWWPHTREALAYLRGLFTNTRATVDRQPQAGHNINLGWTARP